METSKWLDYESLLFANEKFEHIDLTSLEHTRNGDFNTQLTFNNCIIGSIGDTIKTYTKKISFINCDIGRFGFHGTCFSAGLEMKNCIVHEHSFFSAIGHNLDPKEFIIENCIFDNYVDFFDCYFEGPVRITKNNFKKGTNVGHYLQPPYGIPEGIEFCLENNVGDIYKYDDNDAMGNKNSE